jgi:hypothetical protein
VTFDSNKEWARWVSDMILLGFQVGLDDDILSAASLGLSDFNEIITERQGYWINRHGLTGPLGAYYRLEQVVSRLDRLIYLLELLPDIKEQMLPSLETPEALLEKALKHPDPANGAPVCPPEYPEEDEETENPLEKVFKWPEIGGV